ncbi:hypothetical protein GCM10010198_47410 [Nocardia seriolae]|nr:hypothetical protein NS14008_24215 [Nocardia seriolae]PSK30717.1 hypothetical protein C6575_14085 [Nocardia seriolae]RLP29008.1 hypothetical protein D6158_26275 [Nocardia seriolae]GEM24125.1 hypothetical protein NS2_23640 [Nocardia seriolae NBRC 15557]
MPRCVGGGKIRYATQRDADLVLAGLDRSDTERREKNSYPCNTCRGWHLTSWTTAKYERYIAAMHSDAARHDGAFPLEQFGPAAEIARKPLHLNEIAADTDAVPTPAEVAARTAAPLADSAAAPMATNAESAGPDTDPMTLGTAEVPDPVSVASASVIAEVQPLSALPARTVPSPAEVAARTVPIKRAEAARKQAELIAAAYAARPRPDATPTGTRNFLRAILRRLVRRLRRG